MISFEQFQASLNTATAPAEISPALQALWCDARGDWDRAHELAQELEDTEGAWVHAYLHRKEGDPGNAAYWYRRAGKPASHDSLEAEWERIARSLLAG